ncbi:hypothetical protein GCM10023085_55590 [Actinomadura viridis]|uniref:Uncharacterized protein n=1 Tax=Actinomadura viridis TaxID=58110 RepID=A0A931DFI0_9ACTN|nr:hypothetical protein [Actinomadura viridis]MBG6086516.1 hypothetical protein [Actinomadura viridis]
MGPVMAWQGMRSVAIRVDGREIEIRELACGIFNVFDVRGTRLAVVVRLSGGWWLGVRIGGPRRDMHVPVDIGVQESVLEGVMEVTRSLLGR